MDLPVLCVMYLLQLDMILQQLLLLLLLLSCILTGSVTIYDNVKDMDLKTPEIILKYNFPLEIHENVSSQGGYLMDIYRLVGVPGSIPVLIVHGAGGSSRNFVMNGFKDSLAFILHRRGFDVWLANTRGCNYSRKHKTLDPFKDMKYWEFSIHEIAIYDIPTTMDLITNITGHERMFYIGHSQGTTDSYILNAYRPEYNKRFLLCISLGPVSYLNHIPIPMVQFLSRIEPIIFKSVKEFNFRVLPPKDFFYAIARNFCQRAGGFRDSCATFVYILLGDSPNQLYLSRLATWAGDGLSTASVFQYLHYSQFVNTGQFGAYDWHSPEENIEHYGTPTPPLYNLSKVTAPVAVYYGQNDKLLHQIDLNRLCKELANCVLVYKVPNPEFNHLDVVFGKDVEKLVFDHMIDLMRKYKRGQEYLKKRVKYGQR